MTLQNLKSLEWWIARYNEPSSKVAIAALCALAGISTAGWFQKASLALGALFVFLGYTTPERAGLASSDEVAKPEASPAGGDQPAPGPEGQLTPKPPPANP
jgi:hypothetical protein